MFDARQKDTKKKTEQRLGPKFTRPGTVMCELFQRNVFFFLLIGNSLLATVFFFVKFLGSWPRGALKLPPPFLPPFPRPSCLFSLSFFREVLNLLEVVGHTGLLEPSPVPPSPPHPSSHASSLYPPSLIRL